LEKFAALASGKAVLRAVSDFDEPWIGKTLAQKVEL
jgi:hypothetical protein